MPGTKKNAPPHPAHWIGGQRRKLIRRNRSNAGPPRSSTMPVLNPESAAVSLVNNVSSVGSGHAKNGPSEDSYDLLQGSTPQELEASEDKMQFYLPSGAVKSGSPYPPFAEDPATFQPKLTAIDGKKKQGLFGTKKPKALDRANSFPHTPVVTSPLPISTPSKAAKFFGLETKLANPESPRRAQLQDDGVTDDGAPVRPVLKKQHSLPLLTRLKVGTDRQFKFKEEDIEPDELKPTRTTKTGPTKGLRMLIPEFAGPRRSPIQQFTDAIRRFDLDENDDDFSCRSDSGLQEPRFYIPTAPRPVPAVPKRHRMRKKSPKDFERMSPITEASFESLRPAYRKGEDITELGVISEYEYDHTPRSAPVLPPSHTETTLLPYDIFVLDEADLSPTDAFYVEEDDIVHPGTKVDLDRMRCQQGAAVYIRGPLQSAEDAYLDGTEEAMRLEARRITLARVKSERQAVDARINVLRREHEQLKLDFNTGISNGCARVEPELMPFEDSVGDDADLASLSGNVYLDEDPTVHEAKVIKLTRVTPGMVKLVEIPPVKKKPVGYPCSNNPIANTLALVEREKKCVAAVTSAENNPPANPLITRCHHEYLDCTTKAKQSKLARDESRLLVQDWITDYNSTKQRPISTRVDPDVLTDQETPPAPFPKSDEALPTAPIKTRSDSLKLPTSLQKYQCISNGHIFHPIDLKKIPDNALVNSLEVRPYIQTYTGIKQHVKIPVLCEKCGEDCDENVWECEIAVCRIAVCQSCAEIMKIEWQERAVNGWKQR